MRHARHQAHGNHQWPPTPPAPSARRNICRLTWRAHVFRAGNTRHHDRRRGGQQQRRDLRHQTVTDGQQGVDLAGLDETPSHAGHTDGDATDQVDEQNQQAGDRIAAHELAGTVHRAVEVGFRDTCGAPRPRLADQAGVEVGVDRHLLAGHGVQGKTRGNLGNTPGTLGDHHEVDDHQDGEHHDTDHVVAADHHLAEGLDHLAGGRVAILAVQQHHAGGGHVQRQPQQGVATSRMVGNTAKSSGRRA